MNTVFSIEPIWLETGSGPAEIRKTTASVRIKLGDTVLTRIDDDRSKSVRDDIIVSTYPLALWFATSWWRLVWEPASVRRDIVDWRMAHEMTAAGNGYIWPHVRFETDMESIDVTCRRSSPVATEPIRFLNDGCESVPTEAFQRGVGDFITLVVDRLEAVGVDNSDLARIWEDVCLERRDAVATEYRRLEAQLGADPDEIEEETVGDFIALSREVGEAAIREVAPLCAGSDPVGALNRVVNLARSPGTEGRIPTIVGLEQHVGGRGEDTIRPWERGWRLAETARRIWGLGTEPLPDRSLSGLLSIPESVLVQDGAAGGQPRVGMVVRRGAAEGVTFHFRKRRAEARRFEAARFLAAALVASDNERWLLATGSETASQKLQRAFAAEFLCPFESLNGYLGEDYSQDAIDGAGEHFGISPLAVQSILANHGLIPKFPPYGRPGSDLA